MLKVKVIARWEFCPKGLTDYIADAIILDDDGTSGDIPCRVGFCEGYDEIEPTYIFIQDGITDKDCHFYAETIEIYSDPRNYEIDNSINEEV